MSDLHELVQEGDLEAVKAALAAGADPDSPDDNDNNTLLTLARRSPEGSVEIGKALIEAGANVNATSDTGWTPLAWAIVEENVALVQLLVDHGARSDVPIKVDLADAGIKPGTTARGVVEFRAEYAEDEGSSSVRMLAILDAAGPAAASEGEGETSFPEGHPYETRAVLIYGYGIDDAPLEALQALWGVAARSEGVQLVAAADVENTDEDDWNQMSLFLGVVIREVRGEDGDHEVSMSFEALRAAVDRAASVVGGLAEPIEAFRQEYADATVEPPKLALVCSGWLASAILCKGEWFYVDPEEDEEDEEPEPQQQGDYSVQLERGSEGSSQEEYEAGGVLGIRVAAESFDASAWAEITLDPDEDAKMNAALEAAGISGRDYYVISRYD